MKITAVGKLYACNLKVEGEQNNVLGVECTLLVKDATVHNLTILFTNNLSTHVKPTLVAVKPEYWLWIYSHSLIVWLGPTGCTN